MFTVQPHKLFSFHVPQLAALPALERQPVNLAAFMQTDAGELLFAMRTNDMRNIRFHSRRYAQHLLVHLLLSMITQIKRRLVAIYFSKRGRGTARRYEKRLHGFVQPCVYSYTFMVPDALTTSISQSSDVNLYGVE